MLFLLPYKSIFTGLDAIGFNCTEQMGIDEHNEKVVPGIPTIHMCAQLCLQEVVFVCNSFDYATQYEEKSDVCMLSVDTYLTAQFRRHDQLKTTYCHRGRL